MKPACEPCVGEGTRVRLHRLGMRPDGRADGREWVVGRVETGEFVVIPAEGRQVLELLGAGLSVGEVGARVGAEGGQELDIAEFVESLLELGFVAEVDGHPVTEPTAPRPTWGWLRPGHVRWMLHPLSGLVAGVVVLAGVVAVIRRPGLVPGYQDLLWNDSRGALAVLGDATLGWTIVLLHELGHLCTARAAGAPARMTLGTRLQFLVAQTDVSGIWSAPRRTRLTVYLAGMTVNLVIAAAAILTRGLTPAVIPAHGLIDQAAAAAAAISLVGLCGEFLLFMRTDIYFVVQDLTGAPNLYANSGAYLRYLARLLTRRLRPKTTPRPLDPSRALPARQRRAILAYTPLLVLGTGVCLTVAASVTIPAAVSILGHALSTLFTPPSTPPSARPFGQLVDAATALLLTTATWALWARAWWRRHARRTRAAVTHLTQRFASAFIHAPGWLARSGGKGNTGVRNTIWAAVRGR